jgi:hypothetical protein
LEIPVANVPIWRFIQGCRRLTELKRPLIAYFRAAREVAGSFAGRVANVNDLPENGLDLRNRWDVR